MIGKIWHIFDAYLMYDDLMTMTNEKKRSIIWIERKNKRKMRWSEAKNQSWLTGRVKKNVQLLAQLGVVHRRLHSWSLNDSFFPFLSIYHNDQLHDQYRPYN